MNSPTPNQKKKRELVRRQTVLTLFSIKRQTSTLVVQVAVLVNTDIVFDSDTVVMSIARAHSRFSNYFLVAARFDVDSPSDRADSPNATLHTYGGVDLWAWNTHVNTDQEGTNNGNVLVKGRIPGFINGRGKWISADKTELLFYMQPY